VTIPVKTSQKARNNLDPESFFVIRFWGRRPDGFAINEALQIGYILEFKRSTDRDEEFLEVKEAEANEQHKSIIGALKAAAPEFERINFVVGKHGCDIGMRSAQLGDCVLPPAGARRYEANHRGIEGEYWAQCARVRR